MALPVTITGLSTAVAPVGPFKIAAGNYSGVGIETVPGATNSATNITGGSGANAAIGQTLTNGASALTIQSIIVGLCKIGAPTDNVYLEITATDLAGAVLATSNQIACSTITATTPIPPSLLTFTFPSPPTISASATFGVRVKRSQSTADGANCPQGAGTNTNPYAGGSIWVFNGSVWTATSGSDLKVTVNQAVTVANDAYYFFGRDGTAATTLQAFKASDQVGDGAIAQNLTSNTNGNIGNTSTLQKVGQSFTTVGAASAKYIRLPIWKSGSPTDNLTVDIFAVDGSGLPTGASLGTTTAVAGSSLGTAALTTNLGLVFTFPTAVSLAAATKYCYAISRSGAVDAANYYSYASNNASVSAGGNVVSWNGTSWSNTTSLDAGHAIYDSTAWTSIATKTGFTTALLNITGDVDPSNSGLIHLLVQDGTMPSSVATKYLSFNMLTETFLATTETVSAAAALTGGGFGGHNCSIAVRSNGEAVAFFSGVQTKTSGTFYSRVYYSRRTAVNTWSAAVQVDSVSAVNHTSPGCALGIGDAVHFLWSGGVDLLQRTLSAANALQTASAALTSYGNSTGAVALTTVESYDAGGGVTKVVVATHNSSNAPAHARFDAAATPTLVAPTTAPVYGSGGRYPRVYVDPFNGDVYGTSLRISTDIGLFVSKSVDSGAVYGATTKIFNAAAIGSGSDVQQSRDAKIFQRNNAFILPYIANDNGTWRYGEYITSYVSVADAWNANDRVPATGIALSNGDKTATSFGSGNGIHSTTPHLHGAAGKYYVEFAPAGTLPTASYIGIHVKTVAPNNTGNGIYCQLNNGNITVGSTVTLFNTFTSFAAGDILSLAWDSGAKLIWFRKNSGLWNNNASADPATGVGGVNGAALAAVDFVLWEYFNQGGASVTVRTELADLTLTVPVGFKSWMGESVAVADAWNVNDTTAGMSLSNGDKTSTVTSPSGWEASRSTQTRANSVAGKHYAEFKVHDTGFGSLGIKSATKLITDQQLGSVFVGLNSGNIYSQWPLNDQSYPGTLGAFAANDVLSVAWDAGAEKIWFRKNSNNWMADAAADPATGVGGFDISNQNDANYALWHLGDGSDATSISVRALKAEFTQTTPDGFTSWMGEALTVPDRGTLVAGVATVSGSGAVTAVGTGALAAQIATSPGFGKSESVGTGALTAATASRKNSLRGSEQIDVYATPTDVTITADTVVAPDGTTTAETITESLTTATHYFSSPSANMPAGPLAFSIHTKAGTCNWIQLWVGTEGVINFNIQTGAVGWSSSPALAGAVTNAGNGWFRCSVVNADFAGDSVITPSVALLQGDTQAFSPSHLGTGKTIHAWGWQYETASAPTAYIKTTTAAVTVSGALVGTGVAAWIATGALVAVPALLAAVGTVASPPVTGTGTLTTGIATLSGPGTSQSNGTSALTVSSCTLTGVGISQVAFTAALAASTSSLAGVGISQSRQTSSALQAQSNFLQLGSGVSGSLGTAALLSTVGVVSGAGAVLLPTGTGTLVAGIAALAGNGLVQSPPAIGTGALAPGIAGLAGFGISNSFGTAALTSSSTLTGVGTSSIAASGALLASSSVAVGPGISRSVSTSAALASQSNLLQLGNGVSSSRSTSAALAASASTLVGVGVGNLATGTGALASVATLAGAGVSTWVATAPLSAQVAALTGVGVRAWAASGTLPAQPALAAALGVSSSSSTSAALLSPTATLVAQGFVATGVSGIGTLTSFATITAAGISRSVGTAGAMVGAPSTIVAPGVSQSLGTGTMPSAPGALAASGLSSSVGTAALAAQTATAAGVGVSRWVATGALLAGSASIVSAGLVRWAASGALAPVAAAVVGAGVSSSRSTTAALQATVATVFGAEGVVTISGAGALSAQSAAVAGIGRGVSTGTGSLLFPSATLAGAGLSRSEGAAPLLSQACVMTGSGSVNVQGFGVLAPAGSVVTGLGALTDSARGDGALAAQASAITGVGKTGWLGTGALAAQTSVATGTGVARWVAAGVLPASDAIISGAGSSASTAAAAQLLAARSSVWGYEGIVVISGAGALKAQSGSIVAPGTAEWLGAGALAAEGPSVSGISVTGSRGTGVLVVSATAAMAGSGISRVEGAAALVARPATLFGAAVLVTSGAGELVAQDHALAGTGKQIADGYGVLRHTTRSEIVGDGLTGSVGTAEIVSRRALMQGFATQVARATGQLVAGNATITGGQLIVYSGDGEIIAGAAEIVGVGTGGDATWEYAEPTPLPGSYPGTSVYNPVGIAAAPTGAASPTLPPPAWWLGNAA